ncbi:MAG: EAL domain-containing protein [Nodosilinea sp.]
MPRSKLPSTLKTRSVHIGDRIRQIIVPAFLYQSAGKLAATGTKIVLLSSVLAGAFVSGVKYLGMIEPPELFLFDGLVRSQPSRDLHPRVTIIGITEGDIRQYGWPLVDTQLANLLQKLQSHHPSVIGLDLYRSTLHPPGSQALIKQLAAKNLIVIKKVDSASDGNEVPPPPTVEPDRVGFNDFPTDSDNVIRRNLLFVPGKTAKHYSFSLRLILADHHPPLSFRFDDNANNLYLGGLTIPALSAQDGGYQTVDNGGYQILLRYRGQDISNHQLSISQILSGQFDPSWITNKVVLIGSIAPSLKDSFPTPFSFSQTRDFKMSGVAIHAQMVSQLLDLMEGKPALYRFLAPWAEGLWLWGWCVVAGTLTWLIQRPLLLFFASLGVTAILGGVGWFGISQLFWLPMAEPILGLLTTAAVVTAYKVLYRSTHDPLTGLPNRDAFLISIEKALRQHQRPASLPVITVFMGVDRFKVINESLGHHAGDQVLRIMAQRLLEFMPPDAKVARVGGDEFALLLTSLDCDTVGQRMDALQDSLSEPITLGGQKLPSTISMGMAINQTGFEHRPADLLRDAHTAMYRAKALGKSRFEIFASGMLTEAVNRLQLESDLITALDNQEFLLYYQPIIRLHTGELAGFEALVRWRQKDRGFVLPGTFIPAAEETGLIMALGQWIFREACQQLQQWHEAFPEYQHLTMSINLSNRQFGQSDLIDQVERTLQETRVRGECIRLEITESMVMGDVDRAIDLMLKLKSFDLKLAIDDFGTGYSSLSYLHRFPMDTLKIDKSFVGRKDWAIIQTILTLGKTLGMEVVAEGVETEEQVTILNQEGCNYGQGYFFAKPLAKEGAENLLQLGIENLRQSWGKERVIQKNQPEGIPR